MTRREWLLTLPALAAAGCSMKAKLPAAGQPAVVIQRAVDWLVAQQAGDGGWHSETYGLLRSGQSLTPFALLALLESDAAVDSQVIDLAVAFIVKNTDMEGCLGRADASAVDYPNYATGLALRTVVKAKRAGWQALAARMIGYLRDQQFSESLGWKPDDAPYGGWGIGGGRRTPPNPGHVDLCMTRHVLEGLAAAGVPLDDPVFARARVFVNRCQNFNPDSDSVDGGFFFSTVVLDANKAGEKGGKFLSYGTMTADGVLAMLAMGVKADHPRLVAARHWLAKNHRPDGVPGFQGDALQRWTQGLFYYYVCAYTDAAAGSRLTPDRRVADQLAMRQRPDGSWVNPENLVKEDDPLIATPFGIRALAALQRPVNSSSNRS